MIYSKYGKEIRRVERGIEEMHDDIEYSDDIYETVPLCATEEKIALHNTSHERDVRVHRHVILVIPPNWSAVY